MIRTKKRMTTEKFIGALRKNMYLDFDAYSNYLFMQCLDKTLNEFKMRRVDVCPRYNREGSPE